jgi:hypothetical protein
MILEDIYFYQSLIKSFFHYFLSQVFWQTTQLLFCFIQISFRIIDILQILSGWSLKICIYIFLVHILTKALQLGCKLIWFYSVIIDKITNVIEHKSKEPTRKQC